MAGLGGGKGGGGGWALASAGAGGAAGAVGGGTGSTSDADSGAGGATGAWGSAFGAVSTSGAGGGTMAAGSTGGGASGGAGGGGAGGGGAASSGCSSRICSSRYSAVILSSELEATRAAVRPNAFALDNTCLLSKPSFFEMSYIRTGIFLCHFGPCLPHSLHGHDPKSPGFPAPAPYQLEMGVSPTLSVRRAASARAASSIVAA